MTLMKQPLYSGMRQRRPGLWRKSTIDLKVNNHSTQTAAAPSQFTPFKPWPDVLNRDSIFPSCDSTCPSRDCQGAALDDDGGRLTRQPPPQGRDSDSDSLLASPFSRQAEAMQLLCFRFAGGSRLPPRVSSECSGRSRPPEREAHRIHVASRGGVRASQGRVARRASNRRTMLSHANDRFVTRRHCRCTHLLSCVVVLASRQLGGFEPRLFRACRGCRPGVEHPTLGRASGCSRH